MKPDLIPALLIAFLVSCASCSAPRIKRATGYKGEPMNSRRYRVGSAEIGRDLDLAELYAGMPKPANLTVPDGWYISSIPRSPSLDPPFPEFYYNYLLLRSDVGGFNIAIHPRRLPVPTEETIRNDESIVRFHSYIFDIYPSPPPPIISRVSSFKCLGGGSRSVFLRKGGPYFGERLKYVAGVKFTNEVGIGLCLFGDDGKDCNAALPALQMIASQFAVVE